jgi:hypothetical protein
MKAPTPIALNKVKPANNLELAKYLLGLLATATRPSPAVLVRAEIPAKPANPANPAVAANELFPGSPAYAAGAARPKFAAISSPAVLPLPGWDGAVEFTATEMKAYIPLANGGALLGGSPTDLSKVMEFTPAALAINDYVGNQGSGTTVFAADPAAPTAEKLFYKTALAIVAAGTLGASIVDSSFTANTPQGDLVFPCKLVTLPLSTDLNPQ